MNLNEIGKLCSDIAKSKGFSVARLDDLMSIAFETNLIHGEVSEAFEAARKQDADVSGKVFHKELIDVLIYVLKLLYDTGADIDAMLMEKVAFNKNRPYQHGKRV